MKVLITGVAGFVGSNLAHYIAAERDWELVGLDALTYAGSLARIEGLIRDKKLRFVRGSILDGEMVNQLFLKERFDLVLNLASENRTSESGFYGGTIRTNVEGTNALLEAASLAKIPRFVHTSTMKVYGRHETPSENAPLAPTSRLAATKAAADLMVLAYNRSSRLNTVITRFGDSYGPHQFPHEMVGGAITRLIEEKAFDHHQLSLQEKRLTYVGDICAGIVAAAERGGCGEVYNLGMDGHEGVVSERNLVQFLHTLLDRPCPVAATDPSTSDRQEYRKAQHELSWSASTSLREGLSRTIEWYCANTEWWRKIKTGEYLD